MQHPDEGTIHAWLDDALPAPERDAVADHVAHCAECAAAVAEARGMIAGASRILSALDAVPGGVLPRTHEGKRPRSTWRALHLTPARAALAATLMVAVAGLLTARYQRSENRGISANSATPVAAPGATPSGSTARAPAPEPLAPVPVPRAHKAAVSPAVSASRANPAAHMPVPRSTESAAPPQKPERAQATEAKARVDTVAAGAAPPPAAGANVVAGGEANAPRLRQAPADTGARVARATSARRIMSAMVAARPTLSDAAMQSGFAGCYEISNDATARSMKIPLRFALQRAAPLARGGAMRNIAVVLTAEGRVDSLGVSGTWRVVNATTVVVSWMLGSAPATLTIRVAGSQMSAQAETPAGNGAVTVTRIACQ